MIPKLSAPMTKAIRTSEGILVLLVNAAVLVATLVDPAKMPPQQAAKWAVIVTGVHVVQRGVLKATALLTDFGYGPADVVSAQDQAKIENVANTVVPQVQADVAAAAAPHASELAVAEQGAGQFVSDLEEFAAPPPDVPASATTPDGAPGDLPSSAPAASAAPSPTGPSA